MQSNLILSLGFLVTDKYKTVGYKGAVDITVKNPNGEIFHEEKGLEEKELELTTYGSQGPWQICMKINQEKGKKASIIVDLTYFTMNQRSLVGTAWEMNKQRQGGDQGQGQQDQVDLIASLVSRTTELADKDQVAQLSRGIYDLDALLMAVVREQKHIQHRTEAQFQVLGVTKSRMLWWSLLQACIIISASCFQVYMVRRLFEKRDQKWGGSV
eukprot:TRINITY_DN3347_c0_g1_i10.p3 TRINITY_DN3347_c0_g1~~TRINITY_DN3347_c0_g1_i10.p3  ORF type:complete len:231 (-),score=30.76 TRINITY_DN3347_c0_g1_i10:424-1062(-)